MYLHRGMQSQGCEKNDPHVRLGHRLGQRILTTPPPIFFAFANQRRDMSWIDKEASALAKSELHFEHQPETNQSFENGLAKARDGNRLTVADAVELLTTGSSSEGIDPARKESVLEVANRRRAEMVGEEVTFVANLNNNVTTACNTGCLFCKFSSMKSVRSSARENRYRPMDGLNARSGQRGSPDDGHNHVRTRRK